MSSLENDFGDELVISRRVLVKELVLVRPLVSANEIAVEEKSVPLAVRYQRPESERVFDSPRLGATNDMQ